jgi:hypothetical protein
VLVVLVVLDEAEEHRNKLLIRRRNILGFGTN